MFQIFSYQSNSFLGHFILLHSLEIFLPVKGVVSGFEIYEKVKCADSNIPALLQNLSH
jgi:hypothetical protein